MPVTIEPGHADERGIGGIGNAFCDIQPGQACEKSVSVFEAISPWAKMGDAEAAGRGHDGEERKHFVRCNPFEACI